MNGPRGALQRCLVSLVKVAGEYLMLLENSLDLHAVCYLGMEEKRQTPKAAAIRFPFLPEELKTGTVFGRDVERT